MDNDLFPGDLVLDEDGQALAVTEQGAVPLAHLLNTAINSQPVRYARGRPRPGGRPSMFGPDDEDPNAHRQAEYASGERNRAADLAIDYLHQAEQQGGAPEAGLDLEDGVVPEADQDLYEFVPDDLDDLDEPSPDYAPDYYEPALGPPDLDQQAEDDDEEIPGLPTEQEMATGVSELSPEGQQAAVEQFHNWKARGQDASRVLTPEALAGEEPVRLDQYRRPDGSYAPVTPGRH